MLLNPAMRQGQVAAGAGARAKGPQLPLRPFVGRSLPGLGLTCSLNGRTGRDLVVLREAKAELLEAPVKADRAASLNANVNGNSIHAAATVASSAPPPVIPSIVAVAVATTTKPAPSGSSNVGASSSSAAKAAQSSEQAQAMPLPATIDDQHLSINRPAHAGHLASAAGLAPAQRTSAGTPYKNPGGGRWSQIKGYSTFQRTTEIWGFAIQFGWRYFLLNQKWTYGKEGMTPPAVSARKTELAIWLKEGLVKLGPTFIKIGQQFSTRVDVLSPEFIKELESLQDNVPPFDNDNAIQILESSLGKKVAEVFSEFGDAPIAAASLGQVYVAKLRSTGEEVVVKVQRPGLKELFDIDLKNIRALAVWLQKVDPKTDGAARDWVAIYDECSRILYEEIDYRREGKNAEAFRANFANLDWVKVPRVYWEYSTSEILTLEYTPGVKINDAAAIDALGLDRTRLARLSVECYLQQILRHGFFHADPHPGNVAVDAGVPGGRLIYYDFGMMGSISPAVKGGLLDLFYGVYNRDPDLCLDALTVMGVYVPKGDKTAVRRTAEFFLKGFQERLDEQRAERERKGKEVYSADYKPQRSKDESKTRRKAILSAIGEDLLVASNDQPFRFPAAFTFVVRSFTVLDGIGKSLDPRFDISEIAAPYARELLLEGNPVGAKLGKQLKKAFDNQNRAVVNLFKNPNQIEAVASQMNRLERGELKLRVRALEAERALDRVQAWQKVIAAALLASTLVNVGTVLSVSALSTGATAAFLGSAFFALQVIKGYLTVSKLEKKEAQLTGAAA